MLEITMNGLSRSFAERRVWSGLEGSFRGGERVVVRGANGSGKTTLLKVLAGVLAPTEGEVVIREEGDTRDDAWRRRWLGYVGPDLFLYEELTAEENLDFFARVRGMPRDPARDREVLREVGLEKRSDEPVGTLSTGMRQRAKLAFVLQAEPRILLLDEPGSNLDAAGRGLVARVVESAASRNAVVILATNDPLEAELGTRTFELV